MFVNGHKNVNLVSLFSFVKLAYNVICGLSDFYHCWLIFELNICGHLKLSDCEYFRYQLCCLGTFDLCSLGTYFASENHMHLAGWWNLDFLLQENLSHFKLDPPWKYSGAEDSLYQTWFNFQTMNSTSHSNAKLFLMLHHGAIILEACYLTIRNFYSESIH